MDTNLKNELQAAQAKRATITKAMDNLIAEEARVDRRIAELSQDVSHSDLPCWQCDLRRATFAITLDSITPKHSHCPL
jgi:hypothetical protein